LYATSTNARSMDMDAVPMFRQRRRRRERNNGNGNVIAITHISSCSDEHTAIGTSRSTYSLFRARDYHHNRSFTVTSTGTRSSQKSYHHLQAYLNFSTTSGSDIDSNNDNHRRYEFNQLLDHLSNFSNTYYDQNQDQDHYQELDQDQDQDPNEVESIIEQLEMERHSNNRMIDSSNYVKYIAAIQECMRVCVRLETIEGAEWTERLLMLALVDVDIDKADDANDNTGIKQDHLNVGGMYTGPTKEMYTTAIGAWARVKEETNSSYNGTNGATGTGAFMPAQRAVQILDRMWDEYQNKIKLEDENENENSNHDSDGNGGSDSNGDTVRSNTRRRKANGQSMAPKPDIIHYTTLLQCLANANSQAATNIALDVLHKAEMESGVIALMQSMKRNEENTNKSERDRDRDKEELLGIDSLDPNLVPDRRCYNTVLWCLSRYFDSRRDHNSNSNNNSHGHRNNSRNSNSNQDRDRSKHNPTAIVRRMNSILDKMNALGDLLDDNSFRPNTRSYNLLLQAYARPQMCNIITIKTVEGTLLSMMQQAENTLKRKDETLDKSLMVLRDEEVVRELEEYKVLPNAKSFNPLITYYSHDTNSKRGMENALNVLRALLMYQYVPNPSLDLGKSGNANSEGKRSEGESKGIHDQILSHPLMEYMYPDVVTFNSLLACYQKNNTEADKDRNVDADLGQKSETILDYMMGKTSSEEAIGIPRNYATKMTMGDLCIAPDAISYHSVMNAYAKRGKAQDAERILERLIEESEREWEQKNWNNENISRHVLKPTALSFNIVLQAWANSSDVDCGSRAQAVWDRMASLATEFDHDSLTPSKPCWSNLIIAWCKEASQTGAEGSFDKAAELMEEMRWHGYQPISAQYNLLLALPPTSAYREGDEAVKYRIATKARLFLLGLLKDKTLPKRSQPDIYSFNHIIKSFQSFSRRSYRRESIFVAIDTFNALCASNSCNPNANTFIQLLKVIQDSVLDDDDGDERICLDRGGLCAEIFHKCCELGLLTNAVIRICQAEGMLPQESIIRLEACRSDIRDVVNDGSFPERGPLTVSNLPPEWSCKRRVGQNQGKNRKNQN